MSSQAQSGNVGHSSDVTLQNRAACSEPVPADSRHCYRCNTNVRRRFWISSRQRAAALLLATLFGAGLFWVAASVNDMAAAVADDKGKAKSTKRPKAPPPKRSDGSTRSIDAKTEETVASFLKDVEQLAVEYADAGDFERARETLRIARTLKPDDEMLQKKMEFLDEKLLADNDYEIDVNPAAGWESAKAIVSQGKRVRITVDGSYKFSISATVTAAGIPGKDKQHDMLPQFPAGALLGVILKDGESGKEIGTPFLIGEKADIEPRETGMLFLKVNSSAAAKNSGKLKVVISGAVVAP